MSRREGVLLAESESVDSLNESTHFIPELDTVLDTKNRTKLDVSVQVSEL